MVTRCRVVRANREATKLDVNVSSAIFGVVGFLEFQVEVLNGFREERPEAIVIDAPRRCTASQRIHYVFFLHRTLSDDVSNR